MCLPSECWLPIGMRLVTRNVYLLPKQKLYPCFTSVNLLFHTSMLNSCQICRPYNAYLPKQAWCFCSTPPTFLQRLWMRQNGFSRYQKIRILWTLERITFISRLVDDSPWSTRGVKIRPLNTHNNTFEYYTPSSVCMYYITSYISQLYRIGALWGPCPTHQTYFLSSMWASLQMPTRSRHSNLPPPNLCMLYFHQA